MSAQVKPITNAGDAWARYALKQPDISIKQYSQGYELLRGPHAAEWLQRGFEELARTVRNSQHE